MERRVHDGQQVQARELAGQGLQAVLLFRVVDVQALVAQWASTMPEQIYLEPSRSVSQGPELAVIQDAVHLQDKTIWVQNHETTKG